MVNMTPAEELRYEIASIPNPNKVWAKVTKAVGLMVEVIGFGPMASVGARVSLVPRNHPEILCEVIGFREETALLMPYGRLAGVSSGCKAYLRQEGARIHPSQTWLGRTINGLGEPLDNLGPLARGTDPIALKQAPPPARDRKRLGEKLELGVRAVNTFTAICEGQRMGIFSGSGVGKSVLLSMMAKFTTADVAVIGLIGERGREVKEFLEDDLGPEGLKKSIVVVATSDEPPLMRRQAAYLTLALAEYFRGQGKQVLCLMDSVTRFAMAQREIGLSAGEPPTMKGYPPSTFGELAGLLERAGPGVEGEGDITGIFSVLVEGDDANEPVADTVRGILDGHIVMERAIADRGRYPAINVLKSISRSLPAAFDDRQNTLVREAKRLISRYDDMAELIRLGAYKKGTDPEVDLAIQLMPALEKFLTQDKAESTDMAACFDQLEVILGGSPSNINENRG